MPKQPPRVGYELNTGALIASPQLTQTWVPCKILHTNSVGQHYVAAAGRGTRFAPFYAFPKFVRKKSNSA